jgi:hypothetical protein
MRRQQGSRDGAQAGTEIDVAIKGYRARSRPGEWDTRVESRSTATAYRTSFHFRPWRSSVISDGEAASIAESLAKGADTLRKQIGRGEELAGSVTEEREGRSANRRGS